MSEPPKSLGVPEVSEGPGMPSERVTPRIALVRSLVFERILPELLRVKRDGGFAAEANDLRESQEAE